MQRIPTIIIYYAGTQIGQGSPPRASYLVQDEVQRSIRLSSTKSIKTMPTRQLTIRNLTSTTTELKLIEHYEAPSNFNAGGIHFITRNLTALMSNVTSPSAPQLAIHAESFINQDLSLPIAPYEAKITDIATTERDLNNEVIRLTIETEGQRYRLDTSTPSERSIVLTPLSPNPRFQYTAVFLPKFLHLALFSSANLASWMGHLKNESPLSALSIPGTHNSPTCYTALPSVRCQAVSPKVQLENGVRFFDIRVQPENPEIPSKDGLILVHSVFPISLTGNKYFRDLVNDVTAFLDRNPSETVIMSLKREGIGKASDEQLSKILHDHYFCDANRWFTENRIPTLGEVRSKIVIIRRFRIDDSLKGEHNGSGWCIDAESWPDNCEDGLCSSGEIRVQDFYEVEEAVNIDKKIRYSHAHLRRAASCVCLLPGDVKAAGNEPPSRHPFFINFLSASNFFSPKCWPERIAAKVNPSIIDYLCRKHNELEGIGGFDGGDDSKEIGDGSTGIVVCDWVGYNGDWDLVRCIVGHNAKLEMREKGL